MKTRRRFNAAFSKLLTVRTAGEGSARRREPSGPQRVAAVDAGVLGRRDTFLLGFARSQIGDEMDRFLGNDPDGGGPAVVSIELDAQHVRTGWQLPVDERCHAHRLTVDVDL